MLYIYIYICTAATFMIGVIGIGNTVFIATIATSIITITITMNVVMITICTIAARSQARASASWRASRGRWSTSWISYNIIYYNIL